MNRWKIGVAVVMGLMGSLTVARADRPAKVQYLDEAMVMKRGVGASEELPDGEAASEDSAEEPAPVDPEVVVFDGVEYRLDELPPRIRRMLLLQRDRQVPRRTRHPVCDLPPGGTEPISVEPDDPVDPEEPQDPIEVSPQLPVEPPAVERPDRDECHGCGMG